MVLTHTAPRSALPLLLLHFYLLAIVSGLRVAPVRVSGVGNKEHSGRRRLAQQPVTAKFPQLPAQQTACGALNKQCCPNDLCNPGSTCTQKGTKKTCIQCGLVGSPCCNGSCLASTSKCTLQGDQFRCVKAPFAAAANSSGIGLIPGDDGGLNNCGELGLPCCNGNCKNGMCKENTCINWQVTSFTSFSSLSQVQGPAPASPVFGRIG